MNKAATDAPARSSRDFDAAPRVGTGADAARALRLYRLCLGISIALNLAVGVFILFWPSIFAQVLGQPQPSPTTWPSHWGAQLIAINLLYLPGYWQPIQNRWPNVLGIAIRLSFAVFFFTQGDGFIPMGIYDGCFGILLAATYWRAWRANAASGP